MSFGNCCPTRRRGKQMFCPWKRFWPKVRSWKGEAPLTWTWSALGRPNLKPWKKPCTTAPNTDTSTSPSTSGASVSGQTLADHMSMYVMCLIMYVTAPQGSRGLCTLGWSLCGHVSISTAGRWSRVCWRSSAVLRRKSTLRSSSRMACRSCSRSSEPARYSTVLPVTFCCRKNHQVLTKTRV